MTILEMLEWCDKAKDWYEVNFENFQHLQSLELLHKAIVQTQPVGSSLVECDLVYFLLRMAWNDTEHWLADLAESPKGDQCVSELETEEQADQNDALKLAVSMCQPDVRNQASGLTSPCPEQQAADMPIESAKDAWTLEKERALTEPMPKASPDTQLQEESSEDVLIAEKWLQIWKNAKPGRRFSGLGGIHAWENDVLVASGGDVVGLMLELSLMK